MKILLILFIFFSSNAQAKEKISFREMTQEEWRYQSAAFQSKRQPKDAPTFFQQVLREDHQEDAEFVKFILKIFPCMDGEDTEVAFETYQRQLGTNPEIVLRTTAETFLYAFENLNAADRYCMDDENASLVFAAGLRSYRQESAKKSPELYITQKNYLKSKEAVNAEPSYKRVLAPIFESIEASL